MKQIFIKSFTLLLISISVIFISGCDKITVSVFTRIHDDGTAYRSIEYAYKPINSSQLKFIQKNLPDIFEKGFILPSDETWKIDKNISSNTFFYKATKSFESINDLESDYYKKSQFNGASRNYVSFEMTDNTDYVNYNYLEIFKDSANIIIFTNEFHRYLDLNKKEVSQKLYKISKNHIKNFKYEDARDITELFLDKTTAFKETVNQFNIIGPHEKQLMFDKINEFNKDLKIETFIDYLDNKNNENKNSKLIKMFRLRNAGLSEKEKEKLYNDLKKLVREEFRAVAIANKVDPLGAYYTSIDMFNQYSFQYTLQLPGTITKTNGNQINENTVSWQFEPGDFFNHDYPIIAKSYLQKEK